MISSKLETRSIICVPLRSKLRVLGVIQLVNVNMDHFTDQETFFLQSLCDYAAIAIENARSVEKIAEQVVDLEYIQTSKQVANGLTKALPKDTFIVFRDVLRLESI